MLANIHLHVTSQCHDVMSTLIANQCDSLCTDCRFLKTGLVDYIGVLKTPIMGFTDGFVDFNNPFFLKGRQPRPGAPKSDAVNFQKISM